jgi:hypothetical protein
MNLWLKQRKIQPGKIRASTADLGPIGVNQIIAIIFLSVA